MAKEKLTKFKMKSKRKTSNGLVIKQKWLGDKKDVKAWDADNTLACKYIRWREVTKNGKTT